MRKFNPQMDVVRFNQEDIITTSGGSIMPTPLDSCSWIDRDTSSFIAPLQVIKHDGVNYIYAYDKDSGDFSLVDLSGGKKFYIGSAYIDSTIQFKTGEYRQIEEDTLYHVQAKSGPNKAGKITTYYLYVCDGK